MRHAFLLLIGAFIVLFVFSCGQASERSADNLAAESAPAMDDPTSGGGEHAWANSSNGEALADNVAPATMSSSAARATSDTNRRFIRTADLRFRVKDVVKSTYAIEDLIAGFGGHVEHTELTSRVDHRYTTPISQDSLLETTKFTVINRATLRVPAANLDTALKSLARFVDFLDSRTVKAEDVRLMLMSNRMTQQRIARHQQRMETAIDEQGRRLRETAGAEDRLLDRQEQADQARLSSLGLEDRIAYSTIVIDIYQRQSTRHDLLPNEQNIDRYEPGFFSELAASLAFGWKLLVRIVLFIARSWSVLLIMAVIFAVLRRVFRSKPQK
ncbi:MAG: DUF4349 domain-containing protein [Flavobacteriales bacterium]|nr:DUF4349 domain-containing protein [Flavobacteriales bacterium]